MLLPILVELFRDNNSFAHTSQTCFSFNEVKRYFNNERLNLEKVTFYNNMYDIAYYRIKEEDGKDKNEKSESENNSNVHHESTRDSAQKSPKERLIANIQIIHNFYYKKYTKYDVLELYTIYVSPDYRNRGFAKSLIFESTSRLIKRYNLTKPIFALHLNPNDPMMHISFSFYVNLGFLDVAYVKEGPDELQFNMENIDTKWDQIQNKPVTGHYLAMFCFNELGNGIKGDFRELGEKIRGMLLEFIKNNEPIKENDNIK
ncbi:hypothetical protein VCUG_01469 [Vavraia culicis subsp. floridensis]|uniref:N-acetyltransferase domain-containing protein n=1 Tax=Vavraia culicis (isolate floridensis) TaxID=948595 RepID=L2GTT0_VAVCU|nr:uncharacterized protein VCUG_01469 [Vavraia culicis subsp. floridensis]ELA47024.1 hypothetical protein VCUG_01469 [Vavraia culicis subsp. floridensis]